MEVFTGTNRKNNFWNTCGTFLYIIPQ